MSLAIVLKLTCTAEDMLPLADACDFQSGSFHTEYGGRLNKWDEAERAELLAELDAAFFHLYGLDKGDAEYILSTFKGIHDEQPLFPGGVSTAHRILQKYAELSFPAEGLPPHPSAAKDPKKSCDFLPAFPRQSQSTSEKPPHSSLSQEGPLHAHSAPPSINKCQRSSRAQLERIGQAAIDPTTLLGISYRISARGQGGQLERAATLRSPLKKGSGSEPNTVIPWQIALPRGA